MADKKTAKAKEERRRELETFRTEHRSLIGKAIIAGLIVPHAGGLGGIGGLGGGLFLAGPDYDQDSTGDYNQSGGGDHNQVGGNYTQAA